MDDYIRSLQPGDPHGDSHLQHNPIATRVIFQNVNGLPSEPSALKQQQMNTWLQDESVGKALFAETNRH